MLIELTKRVSHKLWRKIVKKERRRKMRQKRAQEVQLKHQQEQAAFMQDSHYVKELERLQHMEEETQRLEEEEARRRKEEWLLRDAALHSKFLNEKRKKQLQEVQQKKQEDLIKKEWEEKQKIEEEKKKKEQEALLKAATESLGKQGEQLTHNPEPPPGYSRKDFSPPKRESCPFFIKTGACRFGIQCSREHVYPERSHTILLPKMYTHFGMDHLAMEEKDSDIVLEYSESEIYQHFREFFEDALPEFQRCGKVVQFKVCGNASPHLRGNVYVQYTGKDDALKACALFNGRWYAGRQLTCYLVTIGKWRYALCGLYWRKQCPKGSHCNFLHAYRNPGNAFWQADRDMQPLGSPRKSPTHHRFRTSRTRHRKSSKASSERKYFQDNQDNECEAAVSHKSEDRTDASGTEMNESSKRKHTSQGSGQISNRSEGSERSSSRSGSRSGRSSSRSERSSSRSERSSGGLEGSSSRSERSRYKSERSSSRSEKSSRRSERSRSNSDRFSSRSEKSFSKSRSKRLKTQKSEASEWTVKE